MSADALLATWTRSARVRGLADDLLLWLPLPLVAAAAAFRWYGAVPASVVVALGVAAVVAAAARRTRRHDARWLARQLDASRLDMEDSAGLLWVPEDALAPVQRLQQARLRQRLEAGLSSDLRLEWSARAISAAWIGGAAAIAAILLWPGTARAPGGLAPGAEGVPAAPGVPRLVGQRLRIEPPAYTGLPARDEASLDAKAPQGSRLIWTLRFEPRPASPSLDFHRGERLALARRGPDWVALHTLNRSSLYRVLPSGRETRPAPPLHRLDAIPDAAPRIKVVTPDHSLSLVTPGQRRWALAFEVSDDYGVSASARLRIVLAQGEGENVTFRERTIAVRGTGSARLRRFALAIDLAAVGFAKGGDLVAQLVVSDNRAPGPQVVRGPSLILRWPSNLGTESTGLEGMAKKVLPAYFRSQRQIIIDAEALIKAKRALRGDAFVARSDGIGVDQRILRLRYGQFLGEESEGGTKPPPTSDAAPPESDNDHGPSLGATPPAFGSATDVLTEYGHTHDEPEAATLLDPATRATLKQALDNMWQSELNLRQGQPQRALPYAYGALRFIKQVQQATRIFLARVGPDLPPIDETRRMTGKRDGLASRALALAPEDGADAVPAAVWRALADAPGTPRGVDLDALEGWLRGNESRLSDPLAFAGAIDAVRRDPACADCRRALRGLLWTALSRPPAHIARREQGDSVGRRYLDALNRTPR